MSLNEASTSCEAKQTRCFLVGVRAFVAEKGLGKVRREVLLKQLKKYDGDVTTSFHDASHVVVCKSLSKAQLDRALNGSSSRDRFTLVSADWLSASFVKGTQVEERDYAIEREVVHDKHAVPGLRANPKDDVCHISQQANDTHEVATKSLRSANDDSKLKRLHNDIESSLSESDEEVDRNHESHLRGDRDGRPSQSGISPHKKIANWVCSQPSSGKCENLNQDITDKLQVLATAYKNTKDTWRAFGYKKAITAIAKFPRKIESREDIASLPHVGSRLAEKIWEIVETGHLRRLDHMDPSTKIINLFADVWGAGATTAESWLAMGFKSLDDLREKAELTSQQKIGVQYYEEFLERMSRAEVEQIESQVRLAAKELCSGLEIVTCGSYRRGKQTCGDIDILMSHKDGKSHAGLLLRLIPRLKEQGLITDDLTMVSSNEQSKYMGVFLLPGENQKHRRIDIIVAPYNEFPCALVHFTGSSHLNRSMRHLAASKGMSLSEHSLNTGVIRRNKEKVHIGTPTLIRSEQDIFDKLGLDYLTPTERDW